ncbi:MAG TPA: hypothetical protein VGK73_16495 [Polyangiaceae bacterium]
MSLFARSLPLVTGLAVLLGTTGCEVENCKGEDGEDAVCAKSLTRFNGEDIQPDSYAYVPGTSVTVDGNYGNIEVLEGHEGRVSVLFQPFNYRAYDEEDDARDEIENSLDTSFDQDDAGNVTVSTGRHDSSNGLGADITLYVPPEFDGALVLRNDSDGPVNPGNVDARFVGQAVSVEVSTDSLGDCSVDSSGSVIFTRAHCDGEIEVTNVSDELDLVSTGLSGSISVILREIHEGSPGGFIQSEDGDITLDFPGGAAFTVQAQATEDGAIDDGALGDACVADAASDTAKSYTCNDGGPNYVVNAGVDGVGPSSVELLF